MTKLGSQQSCAKMYISVGFQTYCETHTRSTAGLIENEGLFRLFFFFLYFTAKRRDDESQNLTISQLDLDL